MTPEREKYLAKCSKREQIIREKIKIMKSALWTSKAIISQSVQILHIPIKEATKFSGIYENKIKLQVYRHELNRLKGFDNVVMPKYCSIRTFEDNEAYAAGFVYKEGECGKCGRYIDIVDKYCPNCGRLILWERVK